VAEVHVLPGVERRDLLGVLPAEQLLAAAIEQGITDVIIVGRKRDGTPYVASGVSNVDCAIGRLMGAVTYLTTAVIKNDQVIDTDEVQV
jgi:hypothetical protein